MQRRRVRKSQPAYPSQRKLSSPLGQRLLLLGMLCSTPLPGCFLFHEDIDGLVAAPHPDLFRVTLPSAGSRSLAYSDGAVLDYHLEVDLTDPELADWVEENEAVLLDRVDELLEETGSAIIAEGEELDALGGAIRAALEQAFGEYDDVPAGNIFDCSIEVDAFVPAADTGDTG
jgi:hypothetical protein